MYHNGHTYAGWPLSAAAPLACTPRRDAPFLGISAQNEPFVSTSGAPAGTLSAMKLTTSKALWIQCVLALGAVGCGGGGGVRAHSVPWADDRAQVIDANRDVEELAPTQSGDCLAFEFEGDDCVTREEACGGDVAADVVLDENGKIASVVCYPEGESLSVEEIEAQDGNVEQNQNDSEIVLDGLDDDVDIDGDLSVDANNVVIYGEGPDVSVVSGDVAVDGNNIIVRGVRIQGDVEVLANNAVFLLCVIEGDVVVNGNNAILSSCDIHGKLTVNGNNTQLSGNRVGSAFADNGKNTVCADNHAAIDADGDKAFSEAEVGEELACGDGKD